MSDPVEELIPELKQATIDWTPDVRCAIVMLMATDRDFYVQNYEQLSSDYFPDEVNRHILDFLYEYFAVHQSLPHRQIVYNMLMKKYRDRDDDWSEAEYEFNRIYDYVLPLANEKDFLQGEITVFCKEEAMKSALRDCFHELTQKQRGHQRFANMEKMFRDAINVGNSVDAGDFYFENVESRYKEWLQRKNEGYKKYKIGFPSAENELDGGLNEGEIAMFVALSGRGKSFMLVNSAIVNIVQGYKVLFVTLENSKEIVERRFDSGFTEICSGDLLSVSQNKVIPKLKKWRQIYPKSLHIAEFPAKSVTINDLKAYENKLYMSTGWRPDVVILDYVDEIKAYRDVKTHESQAEIVVDFRAWMQEKPKKCGFTATQVNRAGANVPIIDEAELADSFGKIRKVDAAYSLNQNDIERAHGVMRVWVMKQRNGRSKYLFYLKSSFSNCQFSEIDTNVYESTMSQAREKIMERTIR